MRRGLDILGAGHKLFPIKDVVELLPKGWMLGFFGDDLFGGMAWPKIEKELKKQGKTLRALRAHLHWGNHQLIPVEKCRKLARYYEKVAKKYPEMTVFVSPSCEYDTNHWGEVEKRVKILRKHAPSCVIVLNPGKGIMIPGVLRERHGDTDAFAGEGISHDGKDIFDINQSKWLEKNQDARYALGWSHRFNMRDPGEVPPPPPERTKIPSRQLIKQVINLMKG